MEKTLNQETYERLKKGIMSLSFKPGEPVSTAKIAELYNVSRTPVRESLVMLQREGLVEIFPQSRSVISKIKPERVRQEWYVRRTLELGMVDVFFEKVTADDISEMEDLLERFEKVGSQPRDSESAYEYLMLDNKFHAVMYRVAEETLAAEIIDKQMAHYNRLRLLIDLNNEKEERTVAAHGTLLELAKKGDKEQYRKMLEIHLGHIFDDMDGARQLLPCYFEG